MTGNASTDFDKTLERLAHRVLAGAPEPLQKSIFYSLLSGGKRIRPRIVLGIGDALSLSREVLNPLAAALEMIHTFTLIHDDLPALDNDDFRRGVLSNHRVHGEAVALLAGDSLALLAFDLLLPLRSLLAPEVILRLITALLEVSGARGVIAGQIEEFSLSEKKDLKNLLNVFRLKTGALFKAAFTLPLLVHEEENSARVRTFGRLGEAAGIGFQIADDLEDSFTEEKNNPAHVAAYLDLNQAKALALQTLSEARSEATGEDSAILRVIDSIFEEVTKKILGNATGKP